MADALTTAVLEISAGLGRIEGKLDQAIHRLDRTDQTINDHEQRLRVLERTNWKQMGVIGTVAAAMSTAVAFIPKLLGGS